MCCVCDQSCSHVGPHAFCAAHGGKPVPVTTVATSASGMCYCTEACQRLGYCPNAGYRPYLHPPARTAQLCPVCLGRGSVRDVPCHGCLGRGWVVA